MNTNTDCLNPRTNIAGLLYNSHSHIEFMYNSFSLNNDACPNESCAYKYEK